MRYSNEHKSATRERIVRHAAEQFRAHGVNGVGVADLMKGAGLTHGGFYAHFESKDELVADAIDAAFEQTRSILQARLEKPGRKDVSSVLRDIYLSKAHRDNPQLGCCLVALGSDMARLGPEAKQRVEKNVKAVLDVMTSAGGLSREDAMRELCAMVGALLIARAVRSESFSKQVLDSVR